MSIFETKSFSDFLVRHLKTLPNKGRGELRSISIQTGIHSTSLSQAVKGDRPFSLEQVANICRYLGLSEMETKFAISLSQAERAGNEALREHFKKELSNQREQARELSSVIRKDKTLSESEKAIFYSNWYYSAIAVLSSIRDFQTPTALGIKTGLSKQKMNQAIEFLVRTGICINKNGSIRPGTNSTHLDSKSPIVSRHHGNWRVKAMEKHTDLQPETDVAYTSPMSLSKDDAEKIRGLITDLVRNIAAIRDPSACEEAYFLNIDWIKL